MNTETQPPVAVASSEGLGVCVLIAGSPVAWFKYHDQAEQWATENYFGRWLMRRATAPEVVPFTDAEMAEHKRMAKELASKLRDAPTAEDDGTCSRCGLAYENAAELTHDCPPGFKTPNVEAKRTVTARAKG